jgi:hypothetical protein
MIMAQAGAAALTASTILQVDALAAQHAVPNSSGTEKPKLKGECVRLPSSHL